MIHTSKDAQATAAICSGGQNPWEAKLREATFGLFAGDLDSVPLLQEIRKASLGGRVEQAHWRENQTAVLTCKGLHRTAWFPSLQQSSRDSPLVLVDAGTC